VVGVFDDGFGGGGEAGGVGGFRFWWWFGFVFLSVEGLSEDASFDELVD
jgi:hypothetical protein